MTTTIALPTDFHHRASHAVSANVFFKTAKKQAKQAVYTADT